MILYRMLTKWLLYRARSLRNKSGRLSRRAHPFLLAGMHTKWSRLMNQSQSAWDKASVLDNQYTQLVFERHVIVEGEVLK